MDSTKKVLIITYYWPPAGGPGVQRWLKFVTYLPLFNVEPIVFIPENPSYPFIDESLLKEIPAGVKTVRFPIREISKYASVISKKKSTVISKGIIPKADKQTTLEKVLLYVRGNFFIPDARRFWVKPSVEFLKEYLVQHHIDTVITTGPPHSVHLIGLKLKESLQIKWIADFRDPWTTIGYHKKLKLNPRSEQKHKKLESKVLKSVDQLIVTSLHTKKEFEEKTDKPIEVITNGYEKTEVGGITKDEKFSFAHIGSLLSERNPTVLWKVFEELIKQNKDFKNNFQLKLIGVVSDEVLNALKKHNLANYIDSFGYLEHDVALQHQRSSRILLLIEIDSQDTKAIIPGKIFEYMNSGTPILAIGPNDSEIQYLINETQSGTFFNYHSEEKLKDQILKYFEEYKNGTLTSKTTNTEMYSRENLTKKLSELI